MSIASLKSKHLPLVGLLFVQLLLGIMLAPRSNFFGIYLNENLAYSVAQVSQVIAFGQIINMIASLIGGSLSDQFGHKWIYALGIGIVAVSSLLYLVHTPWQVILLWGIGNVGLGVLAVSGQGYLTMAANMGILGLASALYNLGYTIGGSIGTPAATLILGENNFYLLGLVLAGFGLLPAVIAGFLPLLRPSVPASVNPVTVIIGYGVLLRRRLLLLSLLRFLPTCYYGITGLFPVLIKQQGGSNVTVAWFVTGYSIFASLTQLIAGRAADRLGTRLPTQIAFSTILLAIVGTILTANSTWGLYIFGTLGIGGAWTLSTLLPGMVASAAEPEIRGRVFGGLHLVWAVAMMLGTLLGGQLIELDMRLPFILVGILNLIALMLTVPFFQMPAPEPVAA